MGKRGTDFEIEDPHERVQALWDNYIANPVRHHFLISSLLPLLLLSRRKAYPKPITLSTCCAQLHTSQPLPSPFQPLTRRRLPLKPPHNTPSS